MRDCVSVVKKTGSKHVVPRAALVLKICNSRREYGYFG